jgi:hypothetical protein
VILGVIWLCTLVVTRMTVGKSAVISPKAVKRSDYGYFNLVDQMTKKTL